MKVLMWVNGLFVALLLVVTIWGAFDVHNRMPIVMLCQIPCLVFMAIRRFLK